jgi:hypothetical protein
VVKSKHLSLLKKQVEFQNRQKTSRQKATASNGNTNYTNPLSVSGFKTSTDPLGIACSEDPVEIARLKKKAEKKREVKEKEQEKRKLKRKMAMAKTFGMSVGEIQKDVLAKEEDGRDGENKDGENNVNEANLGEHLDKEIQEATDKCAQMKVEAEEVETRDETASAGVSETRDEDGDSNHNANESANSSQQDFRVPYKNISFPPGADWFSDFQLFVDVGKGNEKEASRGRGGA